MPATSPPPLAAPSLQGRLGIVQNKKAPLEGSCRRSRLRGVTAPDYSLKSNNLFGVISSASQISKITSSETAQLTVSICLYSIRQAIVVPTQQDSIPHLAYGPCVVEHTPRRFTIKTCTFTGHRPKGVGMHAAEIALAVWIIQPDTLEVQ